jgi:hypothetical protein
MFFRRGGKAEDLDESARGGIIQEAAQGKFLSKAIIPCFRRRMQKSKEMGQILTTPSKANGHLGRLSPAGLSPAPGITVHPNRTHSYSKFCNEELELLKLFAGTLG